MLECFQKLRVCTLVLLGSEKIQYRLHHFRVNQLRVNSNHLPGFVLITDTVLFKSRIEFIYCTIYGFLPNLWTKGVRRHSPTCETKRKFNHIDDLLVVSMIKYEIHHLLVDSVHWRLR